MSWSVAERWSHFASGARLRPLVLRVAVVGCAVAGALALIFVTSRSQPDLFTAAGISVLVTAAVYLAEPRAGTIGLLALGTAICAGCTAVLVASGTVPWLLAGFWGGAATLLAGLLDLISRDAPDQMVGVSVAAVVSLLLLSAFGLGEYVRANWTLQERAELERVLRRTVARGSAETEAEPYTLSQVAGGRWAGRTLLRSRDPRASWRAFALAIQQDGWSVESQTPLKELRCRKDGYALVLTASDPETITIDPGPGKYSATSQQYTLMDVAISMQQVEAAPER